MSRTCPIHGCRCLLAPHQLVCDWHWRRLPRWMRDKLRELHHTERGSAREHQAIAASLTYLAERQGQPQPSLRSRAGLQGARA